MVTIQKYFPFYGVSLTKMSYPPVILLVSVGKENQMYTLFEYNFNGQQVVSAIHALDIRKFLAEHPDAKPKR
jgi:hypothetical protein